MNSVPNLTRACARCSVPLRPRSNNVLRTKQRCLSTSASQRNAQPINLSSSTTPPSASEELTLSHDIISRAATDPSPIKYTENHEPPSKAQPQHAAQERPTIHVGRISRTSTMAKTVQITRQRQVYDKFLQKHYTRPLRLLAHDPNPANFLREGDIVEYSKWTNEEELYKQEKVQARLDKQLDRAIEDDKNNMSQYAKHHGDFDPSSGPAVRKLLRTREREAKEALKDKTRRPKRGVMFVVRRVVTPYAMPLEERLEAANMEQTVPRPASQGVTGTDSLARGKAGNVGKQHANASIAG